MARSGSRRGGKGDVAEVFRNSLVPGCWAVRKYLTDCHRFICEALSMAVKGNFVFSDFHGPLVTKRSNFYSGHVAAATRKTVNPPRNFGKGEE